MPMIAVQKKIYRTHDGIELVADVAGPVGRPTVVLMHGGGQTRRSWSGGQQALAKAGYHVINFDGRGHGESDWSPDGTYSLKLRARDLESVLKDAATPVALVGASMGGATALVAVGEGITPSPAALVMVDIVPRPDPVGTDKVATFMQANPDGFATLDEAADAVAAYNPHRERPKDVSGLRRNLRQGDDGRLYWHWDPRMLQNEATTDPDIFAQTLNAHAMKVTIPTLLVRGMESDVVSEEGVNEFRSLLPSLETFDVMGAGHMVAGDKNDAFNAGVIQFLRRHMPPEDD